MSAAIRAVLLITGNLQSAISTVPVRDDARVKSWFTPKWVGVGGTYVGAVLLLATYALAGHHVGAYLVLLAMTFPSGLVLLLPIYFAMSLADAVSGNGLDGSPASLCVGLAGFVLAAAANVLLLRLANLGYTKRKEQAPARVP